MQLSSLVDPELVFPALTGRDKEGLLRYFAENIARQRGLDPDQLFNDLLEREQLGSTGIGNGIAIPHCRSKELEEVVVAVGLAPEGIPFDAPDCEPVRLFFVVVSSQIDPCQNLRCLSAISHWVQEEGNVAKLLSVPTPLAVRELLHEVQTQ